jgi:hypothetical protein
LAGQRRDAAGELRLDPVQLEAVWCGHTQLARLIIEWDERFYPRAKLLRRQLQLQLGGAGLPEIFHESYLFSTADEGVDRGCCAAGSPHVTRYSTLAR